jgi:hypothetical protein
MGWDGRCPAGKHGLDFEGQTCDRCAVTLPALNPQDYSAPRWATILHHALQDYREAAQALLATRYRDGECDAVMLSRFEARVQDIEDALQASKD